MKNLLSITLELLLWQFQQEVKSDIQTLLQECFQIISATKSFSVRGKELSFICLTIQLV